MNYLLYFFQIIIIKYTSAQVITLGGRNFIPNLNNQNCANIPIAANFANNACLLANIGQTSQLANNIQLTTQDIVNANLLHNNGYSIANGNIGLASGNIPINNNINANIAQEIGNTNLLNNNAGYSIANANIGIASNDVGYTGNIGSETVSNNIPSYINVVQPPREYGIEFSSGALKVGGTVEVNGRMPFNANVAVSGAVPAQGLGAVNYSCDQLNNEES